MALRQPYPDADDDPILIVDLWNKTERDRLSASAAKAFLNTMKLWKVRDEDACQLLTLSRAAFSGMKKRLAEGPDIRSLDQDRLTRISYLIGIFKALRILHGTELADRWVHLPNSNRIFRGATPLDYMIHGGMPAIAMVRSLLDARRGGI
jgi:hypothetical protein